MKQFFVVFFANLMALLVILMIPVLLGIILIASASMNPNFSSGIQVPDGAVLVFDLSLNLTDSPEHDTESDPLKNAFSSSQAESICLHHVIVAIRHAAKDSRIKALYLQGALQPQDFGTGYSNLMELRTAIQEFKDSGKTVISYMEAPTSKDYFLNCIANKVYLNPYGELETPGIASEKMYFFDLFVKYGIQVQVTRVGKYKSAVEPFILDKMSVADREETHRLISDIWGDYITTVCASRPGKNITPDSLQTLIDTEGFIEADKALSSGLVDALKYRGDVIKELAEMAKPDSTDESSFKQIALRDYYAATKPVSTKDSKIAVLYLEGEIVDGEGAASSIGGDRFAAYLRYLAAEKSVKAVVLRVNSPGGSAFASEVIQHEIIELRKSGKPVIVSMGNYAASGGYWVSAFSDCIYAEPNTITGSIGVFGMFFNVKGLADKLGVTTDTEKVGNFADFDTIYRPKTDQELNLAQLQVNDLYHKFVLKVSKGRKIDEAKVEEIAQGRVWTGKAALEIGLVDKMGGLDDAIQDAADRAQVSKGSYTVMEYPRTLKLAEKLAMALAGYKEPVMSVDPTISIPATSVDANPLFKATDALRSQLSSLRNYNDPMGLYARLPLGFELK